MENNIDFLDIFIYCVILCPTHLLDWNYLTTKFSQWVIPLYKYQFDYIGCVGGVKLFRPIWMDACAHNYLGYLKYPNETYSYFLYACLKLSYFSLQAFMEIAYCKWKLSNTTKIFLYYSVRTKLHASIIRTLAIATHFSGISWIRMTKSTRVSDWHFY